MHRIPFNRPSLVGRELDHIRDALEAGNLGGDGLFTTRCGERLKDLTGGKGEALLTSSCTAALEIAGMVVGLGPGDEVIVPSFAYVSSANAFARLGATPVFVDIDKETLNVDPGELESAFSSRTRALLVVHYGGIPGPMDRYREFADRQGLVLIEDAAAALGSTFADVPAGQWGDLACFSFHETKNVGCGQGGALVVNRPEWVETAWAIRDRGTDRQAFAQGLVGSYTWKSFGSAYSLSELSAAFLWGQLEQFEGIQQRRREIVSRYEEGLIQRLAGAGIRGVGIHREARSSFHLFALIFPTPSAREVLRKSLSEKGIHSTFHYQPLHLSEMGRRIGLAVGALRNTELIAASLLRLPVFSGLTDAEVDEIVETTLSLCESMVLVDTE